MDNLGTRLVIAFTSLFVWLLSTTALLLVGWHTWNIGLAILFTGFLWWVIYTVTIGWNRGGRYG